MASKYIKRIKLKQAEKVLGIKLLKGKTSIGFDVAGHETGVALLRTTDTYLILEKIHKFSIPKKVTECDAIDLFTSQLDSFKNDIAKQYKVDKSIIENCFFGQNVNTLKLLARCGILVRDRFRGISKETELIMPTQARNKINFKKSEKTVKGVKLKKEIIAYINAVLDTDLNDSDIVDGIVLALGGLQ